MEQQHCTVKTSIRDLVRNNDIIIRIERHVRYMHILVTHAYAFCKYMFLRELTDDIEHFDIARYLNQFFFQRVILTLAGYIPTDAIDDFRVVQANEFIAIHIADYSNLSGFNSEYLQPNLTNAALYEGMRMVVAYDNTVRANFGKLLRRIVNVILDVEGRKAAIRQQYEFASERFILQQIRDQVTYPASLFKEAIGTNNRDNIPEHYIGAYEQLLPFITYPEGYVFQENIYYDAKANPERHFKNYFRMCQFFHNRQERSYKCFPLRTSIIPCYTTIDTTTLVNVILAVPGQPTYNADQALAYCYPGAQYAKKVVRIDANGQQIGFNFRGTIVTDGVGVSVVNSRVNVHMAGIRGAYNPRLENSEFIQLTNLNQEQVNELGDNVAFFDPGRQDLLYGMHYNSQPNNKIKFRYTRNDRAKITGIKAGRNQRNNIPEDVLEQFHVREAFVILSNTIGSNVDLGDFIGYIHAKNHPFVQGLYEFFATYTIEGHPYSLHRKLRLSSAFGRMKEEVFLAQSIRERLATENLIMGNWSAGMTRFHEPIKGVGMLRMLRRSGFNVMIIDEFLTSTFCPNCHHAVDKPFFCLNPRPYRRLEYCFVRCHGLLKCDQGQCMVNIRGERKHKVWNRDMLAVLNFRIIFNQFRIDQTRPVWLQRN